MRFYIKSIRYVWDENLIVFEIFDTKYKIPFKHVFGDAYYEDLCYGLLNEKYLHELQVKYPLLTDSYIEDCKRKYKY